MHRLKKVVYAICIASILLASWQIHMSKVSTQKTKELYMTLSSRKEEAEEEEYQIFNKELQEEDEIIHDVENGGREVINPWLIDMQEENADLVAWLTIPNTVIDYPVMQRNSDDGFYLHHDFYGNYENHGTPYMDYNCVVGSSNNLIVYAHHKTDGTMFQNLMYYKNPDFCKTNDNIVLHTTKETAEYQVVMVVLLSLYEMNDFPFYNFVNLYTSENFNAYISLCREYAIWEADELPVYGDELLSLSTCEYTKGDGRMVVIARRVK